MSANRRTMSRCALRNHLRELRERNLDVLSGLRGREQERGLVRFRRALHVGLRNRHLVLQIRLVRQEFDRDVPGDLDHGGDPILEVVERLLPRHVAHREDALGPVEVRFFEQFAKAFLAHDVPYRHVDVHAAALAIDLDLFLRDFRGARGGVSVVVLVLDEPPDQARLADRALSDEADLDFHLLAVHHVPEEHHRDVADLLADHLDPVVEVVKGVLAREVADRDHALGALEVRVPEQGPEPFLAHDVPYHHVERRGGALPHDVERLLRDLRADRGDVAVVELVLHEPLDEGGLADRDIPDEADLGLEMLLAGHRGRRHHAPPIERGLMYRADASIAPDNFYSSGSTFRAYRSFATRSARDWNAFSTLTPAFADVKWNGLS